MRSERVTEIVHDELRLALDVQPGSGSGLVEPANADVAVVECRALLRCEDIAFVALERRGHLLFKQEHLQRRFQANVAATCLRLQANAMRWLRLARARELIANANQV